MQNDGQDDEQAIDVGLVIQKFIGHRAVWFKEKTRSTADHLVRFDIYFCSAFAKEEYVIAILFGLEKGLRYHTEIRYTI